MPSREPIAAGADAALAAFARAMRRGRWRWYVFGGQAVLAWGRPRLTADVDVTIDLGQSDVEQLVAELRHAHFDLRFALSREFIAHANLLPFVHLQSRLPFDVVIARSAFEQQFLDRRRYVDLGVGRVPLISAEDLVATKVMAGRRKDLEDARGVLLERWESLDLALARSVVQQLDRVSRGTKLERRFERLIATVERVLAKPRRPRAPRTPAAKRRRRSW